MVSGLMDYYRILSVPFGASDLQLKKKFRELAKKFHPDNLATGQKELFQEILSAYETLSASGKREKYDTGYLKNFHPEKFQSKIPPGRIIFPGSIQNLARKGLLRKGIRNKDRKKYTGIDYDFGILINPDEIGKRILAEIPLTVRVLCPACLGSDLYCGSCGGKGNYKGFRFLKIFFEPEMVSHNKIYEFELSRFRPDRFVHFKKKTLKIKLELENAENPSF